MHYVIGTRGSKLAMAQAESVRARLQEAYPEHTYEILVIKTKGDIVLDRPLYQAGGKGLFVREIEEAILEGRVQIGVHSMKDMPAVPAGGLSFSKIWTREDARDVLILREKHSLEELPTGAVIGTGSRRRQLQLKKLREDLIFVDIRGNVETRICKMRKQKLDGIVLAAAGLKRLGMEEVITQYLTYEQMIPAPAQGALALEFREGDEQVRKMLDDLSDARTDLTVQAERAFLRMIGGGCHLPVGAVCERRETEDKNTRYRLRAVFGDGNGEDLSFADVCGMDPGLLALEAAAKLKRHSGKVSLVGAGPGDPGLITCRGLRAIKKADCILYDRLIPRGLLEQAKPECEKIYVGKENCCHTMEQEEINRLLLQKGMEYERTVRLKGGDSYVFGRGGEEALALCECGIEVEVIPGVTSAAAGPACAGIPVTHRGMAEGFHVVTAHHKKDEPVNIDFKAMAQGKETCVFLMGLEKVEEITDGLLKAGMRADMPAALISKAATADQRTVTAKLSDFAEAVRAADLPSPALIVVGETVGLREKLDFFERQPLFGRKYLVTKVGEKVSGVTEMLRENGATVDELQTGEIQKCKLKIRREELEAADWLIFTSRNGVQSFFENLMDAQLDIRLLAHCKIASIGRKTSEALRDFGIYADLEPKEAHSDALWEALQGRVQREDVVWYPGAERTDPRFMEQMEAICRFQKLTVYRSLETEMRLPDDADLYGYDGVFFTCASSVRRFLPLAADAARDWDGKGKIYSIGPKTTQELKKLGMNHCIQAKQASYESLAACVLDPKQRLEKS